MARHLRDVDERIPGTRRQRQVNFGNTQSVVGDQRQPLVDVSQEDSSDLLLTVKCEALSIPAASIGTGDWRPYVKVAWGHGGIDVEAEFEVTFRQRIPLSASKVDVSCFLKSVPLPQSDGTVLFIPVPPTATAAFRGFLSEGTDAEPYYPTRWAEQMDLNAGTLVGAPGIGLYTGSQARLVTFRGWALTEVQGQTGPFARYLHLFDQNTVPVSGDIPVDGWPITCPPTAEPSQVPPDAFKCTRSFTQGLSWAISTTPFVLSLDTHASAFIVAELMQ